MYSSNTVSTNRASRASQAPAPTTTKPKLSALSYKQSSASLKLQATAPSNALSLSTFASQPEPSHTTISYLPATVTTRSPRYRQSQTPQDHKKFFYANEQTKGLTSSPSDAPTLRNTRVPSRSGSRLSTSSSTATSTSMSRTRSSIATLTPHSSSPSVSTSIGLPNSHTSTHAPSKFVYANGEEEVLSPRRTTLSGSGSSTSTISVFTPTPHFRPSSPTYSSSSQSSALSVVDSAEASTAMDDGDTPPAAPVETDAARTNRKILDLEISNTSLLAINRTLEREMRGQSRELRVLKRWIQRHNIGGVEIDIGNLSVSETEDSGIDDESDEGSDSSGDEDDEDMTIGPFSKRSSVRSKGTGSQSVLELDELVQKEKDLLEASQAINGSIRNCLFMSDVLLKEARASLSFKVSEEDLRVGGRVLSYEDTNYTDDDEEEVEIDDTGQEDE
ncbi:uncharacterized protein V1513DRAFT_434932 [Lipomyces chichibuensis]|uniref:uncharacterized protein n=1 Tax=Lipomyces chichibuensis TaxID=1546026 RepID=UPI003343E7CE